MLNALAACRVVIIQFNFIIKCICKCSFKLNFLSCLTGGNHKRGKRQLDNGVDRPEGKQDSWLYDITCNLYKATGYWREQTRGQTRLLAEYHMHPAQEPQMASDMRHHVYLVQELDGLWIVENLATSGLYDMTWYSFSVIILKHLSLMLSRALNNSNNNSI